MRTKVRTAGLALLVLLVCVPAAGASTFGTSGGTAVYTGDPGADTVRMHRYVDTRNNISYYLVTDTGGVSAVSPCVTATSTMAACRITPGLKYQLNTGDGADAVTIAADAPGGSTDLGAGDDSFTGGNAGDVVHGGEGDDILRAGGGNDQVFGDGGNDQVAGEAGCT